MNWPHTQFGQLYVEPSRNGIYKSREHHGSGCKIINMGELFAYNRIRDQEYENASNLRPPRNLVALFVTATCYLQEDP